ncbi:hypothetical protein GF389_02990 [Candidatus Dojkabacteria bacterium]|nr:hypothetical protein [Candidatus Dojkabacteria bacterium]
MQTSKRIFFLFLYTLFACLIVYIARPPYSLNIVIVYAPPLLINTKWISKEKAEKLLLFALVTTVFWALPVEIISRLADSWDVASDFPRILKVAPIENLLYAFINFLWPLVFYESFIDRDKNTKIPHRFFILLMTYMVFFFTSMPILILKPTLLSLDYWIIGLLFVIGPFIILSVYMPKVLRKTIVPTLFFGIVFLIHELVSMEIGHWYWPGEYLLTTSLFGSLFPVDDIIIWYIFSTPVLLMGYELFLEDKK